MSVNYENGTAYFTFLGTSFNLDGAWKVKGTSLVCSLPEVEAVSLPTAEIAEQVCSWIRAEQDKQALNVEVEQAGQLFDIIRKEVLATAPAGVWSKFNKLLKDFIDKNQKAPQ